MNLKGSVNAILILVIVGLCGVAGYLWLSQKTAIHPPAQQSVAQSTDETRGRQGPPYPQNTTENWNVYSNQRLGFTLKYPSDWIVAVSPRPNVIYAISKEEEKYLLLDRARNFHMVTIIVNSSVSDIPYNEDSKLDFEAWIRQEADNADNCFQQIKPIVVDGVNGYQGTCHTGLTNSFIIFVQNNGFIYEIETETNDGEMPNAFQKAIVDSFRFIPVR